jgi:hypothetical protein
LSPLTATQVSVLNTLDAFTELISLPEYISAPEYSSLKENVGKLIGDSFHSMPGYGGAGGGRRRYSYRKRRGRKVNKTQRRKVNKTRRRNIKNKIK